MSSPAGDEHTARELRTPGRRPRGPWVAAILGALCFANTLINGYAYDDRVLILENPRIHSLTNVRQIWLADWWAHAHQTADENDQRDRLYRPLTLFTFALNYAVHGLHATGFHALNLLLHAVVCFILWHFAKRFTGDSAVATITAVLFAIHPVHTEAVANVVGRAEILAALFLLGGLLILQPTNATPGLRRGLLAMPLFLAAVLSKETAVCYPAVAILVLLAAKQRPRPHPRWWLTHAGLLIVPLLLYFPLRYAALEGQLFRAQPPGVLVNPLVEANFVERVIGPLTIFGHYVRLLVVPDILSCDYGFAIINPQAGFIMMSLLGMIGAGGLLIALVGYARPAPIWRRLGTLAAIFLVSYALISNTILLIGVTLAERLMYWPSVAICILAATLITEFWRRQCATGKTLARSARLLRILGILLLVAIGLRTAVRNSDWFDNYSLFSRDVTTHPQGARLNHMYAVELVRMATGSPTREIQHGLLTEAETRLSAALGVDPAYARALALRGQVRAELGHDDDAFLDLESALLLDPNDRDARRALAQLRLYGVTDAMTRLASLREQVQQQPDDPARRLELANALIELGRFADALPELENVLALDPAHTTARRRLAEALALGHQNDRAIEEFQRVLTESPDDWLAHANLTTLLAENDASAALHHARRAYEINPNDLRTKLNLAEASALDGQTAEALTMYQALLDGPDLDDDNPLRSVIAERIRQLQRR